MREIVWIALGGALGSVARHLASRAVQEWAGSLFPYGILAVNVAGCFGIGLIAGTAPDAPWLSPTARLALATGVLGGFTTFSAFAGDTLLAVESQRWAVALANVVANVVLGILAAAAGAATARAAWG